MLALATSQLSDHGQALCAPYIVTTRASNKHVRLNLLSRCVALPAMQQIVCIGYRHFDAFSAQISRCSQASICPVTDASEMGRVITGLPVPP